MRISDWSSDVCSSDLGGERAGGQRLGADPRGNPGQADRGVGAGDGVAAGPGGAPRAAGGRGAPGCRLSCRLAASEVRKSVVWGRGVVVRVDFVRGRVLTKTNS